MNDAIVAELRRICGDTAVLDEPLQLLTYECDALTHLRESPALVVLPRSAAEVQAVVRVCSRERIPFVARGHGTGLSGGALPVAGGIVISLAKLNRVIDVDIPNRRVTVEPGVTNLEITRQVAPFGYYYAPDPSSQQVCSIGGNVAENSGGAHCLKYGFTVHHVLEVEAVLPDGELVRIGSQTADAPGPDLLGLLVGSEGTLAIVTKVVVRILRRPESVQTLLAAFDSIHAGGAAVSAIIAAGIIPAALEFMDRPCIAAVEAFCAPGYPKGAEAILIAEVDGTETEVAYETRIIGEIARELRATLVHECESAEERARAWSGRKAAFGAMGRLRPDLLCMDGTIPRRALADVLERIAQLSEYYRLGCCNVFHAGDGNLHPLIVFDVMAEGELERAEAFGADILKLCVAVGGVLTGEHGVGVEKKALMGEMFSDIDLKQQERLKCAFDGGNLLNPGKVFPTLHACVEQGHMHVHGGRMPFGNLPRM